MYSLAVGPAAQDDSAPVFCMTDRDDIQRFCASASMLHYVIC